MELIPAHGHRLTDKEQFDSTRLEKLSQLLFRAYVNHTAQSPVFSNAWQTYRSDARAAKNVCGIPQHPG